MTQPVIEIHGLSKRFGNVQSVQDLSFSIKSGAITGFLGPNGAGKTTTLRMLLNLIHPDAGTATINGQAYSELSQPTRHVGAMLESTSIHPGRSARNHLRIRTMAGGVDPKRIDVVLELVGLANKADRRVGTFSLGMRQRLNLAAALLADPEVLILDEPTNGLDPEGIQWLRAFLKQMAHEGKTVLVSSHLLAEVSQIADEIIVLNHGRLVAQSSLKGLLSKAGTSDLEKAFFRLINNSDTEESTK